MEIKLTKDNFEEVVEKSDVPVLIDFYANWCGPCKMLAPHVEEIAKEYEGKLKVCKVDCDEEMELASEFMVVSIPMLVLFKNGGVANTSVGYMDKQQLVDFINK